MRDYFSILKAAIKELAHSSNFFLVYLFSFLVYFIFLLLGIQAALIVKAIFLIILLFSIVHGFYGLICVIEDYTFDKNCNTLFSHICLLLLLKFLLLI